MQTIIATMSTKKVMSIVALVTAAAIFALSSVLVNPVLAQSYGGGEGGDDDGSARENYKEFQKCLSDDETNGVVTEQQIRDCFSPIYNPNGSSGTISTTDYGNSNSDDYNDDDMEDNKQK